MAETEVESILREIRERVAAQQRPAGPSSSAVSNGNGDPQIAMEPASRNQALTENLTLINSYLTTTGRAWDRLPPLVSNRSGATARIELWLKRQFKRATRWYAWEQVNFNAAVHQALRDLLPILSAYQDELDQLRIQLAASEARRAELAATLQQAISAQNAQKESLKTDLAAHQHVTELMKNQIDHRFTVIEDELRARNAALQEELRVCFKQLSLETSEAAVLEDRARRKTDALIEELQRRLNQKQ